MITIAVTFIICLSVVLCAYLICFYINEYNSSTTNKLIAENSLFEDISTIAFIVSKLKNIETYNDVIRNNIALLDDITHKYLDDEDDKTKE